MSLGNTKPAFMETPDIETSSDSYASRFSGKTGAWFLKVQEEATLEMLAPYPGSRVLDVGGGHGQVAGALVRNGYRVTVLGSDEVCKRRIQPILDEDRCSFRVGNILELPFPDRSFDIVVSYRLLSHVTRWEQLISEFARVADNAVIIDYPPIRSLNYIEPLLFSFKKRLEGNTRKFTCFWESELLEAFRSVGFVKDKRFAQFLMPMVLHRVLSNPMLSSAAEKACRITGMTHFFGSPVVLKLVRAEG